MTDHDTTLAQIKDRVHQFVEERDWKQFHAPKNLSMALAIEAAELMEHFQWISSEESRTPDAKKLAEIGEELADVLCYGFALANELNLDITTIFTEKMQKNIQKYPVEQFRGRFGADDPTRVTPSPPDEQ